MSGVFVVRGRELYITEVAWKVRSSVTIKLQLECGANASTATAPAAGHAPRSAYVPLRDLVHGVRLACRTALSSLLAGGCTVIDVQSRRMHSYDKSNVS